MALYTSNTMRMTGLSGIDTESMVNQLMKAESQKLYRLQRQNTTLTWKQEAYWSAIDKLQSFQSKFLSTTSDSSIRMKGNFSSFNTSVKLSSGADSSAVSVTASPTAAGGSYTLKVEQLAQKDTYTTGAISKSGIEGTVDYQYLRGGDNFRVALDGTVKNIEFSQAELDALSNDSDFQDLLNGKLENAFGNLTGGTQKVAADYSNGDLLIKTMEAGHTVSVSEGTARPGSVASFTGTSLTDADFENFFDNSLIGREFKLKAVNESGSSKDVDIKLKDSYNTREDMIRDINSQLSKGGVAATFDYDSATDTLSFKTNGVTREDVTLTDVDENGVSISNGFINTLTGAGNQLIAPKTSTLAVMGINNNDSNQYNSNDKLGDIYSTGFDSNGDMTININNTDIALKATDTVDDLIRKIKNSSAGVTLNYDKLANRFTLISNKEGANNNISFGSGSQELLGAIGFNFTDVSQRKEGADAVFEFNGVRTTRESNTFTQEGVQFSFKAGSEGQSFNIEIEKDPSKTKQLVKDFVTAYNELISDLNGTVNQKRAKSSGSYFEPLTSEDKKAMSEKEIEDWEAKAKEGILNNDSIVSEITSTLRLQIYQGVTLGDGTKLSLHQIGIETSSNYKDQGKLVFDEDAFDAAIEKHGDKIVELFTKSGPTGAAEKKAPGALEITGLGDRINNIMENAVGTRGTLAKKAGVKGNYTEVSNDMLHAIEDQSQKISEMIAYLTKKENDYYLMFSKLEAAVSQSDSQMNYITSVLGL